MTLFLLALNTGAVSQNLSRAMGILLVGYLSQWVSNGRYDRGVLMRFDNNLDSLWSKIFTDSPPHDSSIMFMNCHELNDKGFIIIGGMKRVDGSGYLRANLLRTDSLGNLKWQKTYGPQGATEYNMCDVTCTSDNGYAIGGGSVPENLSPQYIDGLIIKVDSLGNQQWLKHIGNPICRDGSVFVDLALDGNIMAGTVYSDTCYGNDNFFSKINFLKIENNGEIIWDKKYGLAKCWNGLNKINVLESGEIVGTGSYYRYNWDGSFEIISWIIKTDSSGNEQWYREYQIVDGEDSQNILQDVTSTNDNGFIACGMVYPTPPDTGFENSWVLKVDSIGCQGVNDCWEGTHEILVKTFTPGKPWVVYPNPAEDKIHIEFHENSKGAEIHVFDQFGRSQCKSVLAPNRDEMMIDIGNWKAGIYVVRVLLDGRILGTDKVVKIPE